MAENETQKFSRTYEDKRGIQTKVNGINADAYTDFSLGFPVPPDTPIIDNVDIRVMEKPKKKDEGRTPLPIPPYPKKGKQESFLGPEHIHSDPLQVSGKSPPEFPQFSIIPITPAQVPTKEILPLNHGLVPIGPVNASDVLGPENQGVHFDEFGKQVQVYTQEPVPQLPSIIEEPKPVPAEHKRKGLGWLGPTIAAGLLLFLKGDTPIQQYLQSSQDEQTATPQENLGNILVLRPTSKEQPQIYLTAPTQQQTIPLPTPSIQATYNPQDTTTTIASQNLCVMPTAGTPAQMLGEVMQRETSPYKKEDRNQTEINSMYMLEIKLSDGTTYRAQVSGLDPENTRRRTQGLFELTDYCQTDNTSQTNSTILVSENSRVYTTITLPDTTVQEQTYRFNELVDLENIMNQ